MFILGFDVISDEKDDLGCYWQHVKSDDYWKCRGQSTIIFLGYCNYAKDPSTQM